MIKADGKSLEIHLYLRKSIDRRHYEKLLLFIFIIFLTGCTLPDIGNIAVVSSIGISHDKEVYTVYVKILATDDDNEDVILTKTCLKLDDCFYDITKDLSKSFI